MDAGGYNVSFIIIISYMLFNLLIVRMRGLDEWVDQGGGMAGLEGNIM